MSSGSSVAEDAQNPISAAVYPHRDPGRAQQHVAFFRISGLEESLSALTRAQKLQNFVSNKEGTTGCWRPSDLVPCSRGGPLGKCSCEVLALKGCWKGTRREFLLHGRFSDGVTAKGWLRISDRGRVCTAPQGKLKKATEDRRIRFCRIHLCAARSEAGTTSLGDSQGHLVEPRPNSPSNSRSCPSPQN